jgi:hypothetical protein
MVREIKALEDLPHDMLIRDLLRDDAVSYRVTKRISNFKPQDTGLRVCCFDIDDISAQEILGVDEIDHSSRVSLEAAVEAVIAKLLPPGLHAASVYYQWSCSAGVKPWSQYRLHLWFWLDRRVHRASLKRWAKGVDGIDASFFDSVRIHYTARPIFLDHLGGQLPDIMGTDSKGSLRSGVISGASDVATAPDEWLDLPAHIAVERLEKVARADETRRRLAAQRNAQSTPVGRAMYRDQAEGFLRSIIDSITRDLPAKGGRYAHVRAKVRAAFGMREVIDASVIASRLLPVCVDAFRMAGRSDTVAHGEATRLIDGLVHDSARAPAFPLQIRDAFHQESKSKRKSKRAPKPQPKPQPKEEEEVDPFVTGGETYARLETPPGKPWQQPEGGWNADVQPISLDEGHARLDAFMPDAMSPGARTAIAADAGSGKSYAAKIALIKLTQATGGRAQLIVPTLELAAEAASDLNRMAMLEGAETFSATVASSRRGPDSRGQGQTCYRFEEIGEASQSAPQGGLKLCKACPHHPSSDEEETCPFFKAVRMELVADVVVKTHARFVLEGLDTESEDRFAATVIDEDPSGSMMASGYLDAARLSQMVSEGDLEISDAALGGLVALIAESETRRVDSSEIAARVNASEIQVGGDYNGGTTAVGEAVKIEEQDARRTRLRAAVPWRTIAGFADAVADAFAGIQIKRGRIEICHTIPLNLSSSDAVLYLDATASKARAVALLGSDVVFHRVRIELPESVEVDWIPMDAGVGSRLHRLDDGARRVPLVWNAVMARYATKNALVVTSKRNRDLESWTGRLLEAYTERYRTAVIHHRGPGGRGLNRYKDRSTVIIDPWFVPVHVVEQTAFAWCMIAGQDWSTTREMWMCEARAQLEAAEVLQEIARIRPLSASANNPKRIVIIDLRDPRSLGLNLANVLDPDMLAFEASNMKTGQATAPAIVERVVLHAGGVFLPTVDLRSPAPMRAADLRGEALTGNLDDRQGILSDDLQERLAKEPPMSNYAANVLINFAGHNSWEALATRGRVGLEWIETDKGGRPIPMLYIGPVARAKLETWLRIAGARRYRVGDEETWHVLEGYHCDVHDVLATYQQGSQDIDANGVIAELSRRYGYSTRTARRRIDRYRCPDETVLNCLKRLWTEMQTIHALEAIEALETRGYSHFGACDYVLNAVAIPLAPWRTGEREEVLE